MFSLAVLIGRGLDLNGLVLLIQPFTYLYSVLKVLKTSNEKHAPLAQLVEHLTLNQGVPGSSP